MAVLPVVVVVENEGHKVQLAGPVAGLYVPSAHKSQLAPL
jgi:hypothetical protein